jgi:hypothetical protein
MWPCVAAHIVLLRMGSLYHLNGQGPDAKNVVKVSASVSRGGKPLILEREAHGERLVRRVSMASAWALLGHLAANS